MVREDRPRILIVDDEAGARASLEAILLGDFDVVACDGADAALRALGRQPFDVVCSDFQMPQMSGLELLHRVKAVSPATSLLLLTGHEDYFAAASGADFYTLMKPFDPARLVGILVELARHASFKRSTLAAPGSNANGTGRANGARRASGMGGR